MNRGNEKNTGFTLVELTLAMAFVSMLLLAISVTVIQMGEIYNRGIMLKDVNTVGNSIFNDLQITINNSPPFDLGLSKNYVEKKSGSKLLGGRLCLGKYSYIWNFGKYTSDPSANKYLGATGKNIKMVKIADMGNSYCVDSDKGVDPVIAVEMFGDGQHNLALHSFNISTDPGLINNAISQRLYSIGFVLGTNDADSLNGIDTSNPTCKLPNEMGADMSYCYVNSFDIIVRAGNKAK